MKNVFSCQVTLFSLFSVLLFTTTVEAGNRAGSFSVSTMTGAQIFQKNEAMANTDFVGLNFGYNFTKHVGAELVGTVAVVDYQSDFVPAGTGNFNYWTGRLDLLYHFQPDEKFVPYFAAGVGGAFLSQSQNVQGNPVNEDLIVNYGAGFKYFTTDWLALRLDARQVWRHELAYNPVDHGKNYKNYMLSGGLTFQMGGEESASGKNIDADNDGVIDALDRCSGTPYGVAVDTDGCALDTDQDGVINAVDQCPGTAMGAQVDAQGCASLSAAVVAPVVIESVMIEDADLDGVADIDDKCPNTPVEVPVNERGCPADTDHDGVFDVEDNCPGTAAGKAVDANGCEIDYTVLEELNLEISFASNSSKIASKFDTQMQQAADFVEAHPGKKLIVEGHTDSSGSASVNQRLSQKRADTVRWILVSDYGVNRANLKAVGLGEKNPIADNKSQAGRLANRRVIVRLVD